MLIQKNYHFDTNYMYGGYSHTTYVFVQEILQPILDKQKVTCMCVYEQLSC